MTDETLCLYCFDKNNWQRIVLTSSQTDIYIHLDMKAIKTSEIRSVASPESNPPGCPPCPTTPLTPSTTDIFILPAWREVTSAVHPHPCPGSGSGTCLDNVRSLYRVYTDCTHWTPCIVHRHHHPHNKTINLSLNTAEDIATSEHGYASTSTWQRMQLKYLGHIGSY